MVRVAFPLLALQYTHSPVLVAGVALADRLPALLVGLPAGAVADRLPRRLVALLSAWGRLVVVGGFGALLALGWGGLPLLYVTVLLLGCGEQFYEAAAFAVLPSIVHRSDLDGANSRLFVVDVVGEQFVGQAAGGAALALSRAVPFVLDGASFGLAALLFGWCVPKEAARPAPATSLRKDLLVGLRWFAGHPLLRTLAILIGSFAFCQTMVFSIFVLYARLELHISTAGYGLFMAITAVGGILGSWLSPGAVRRLGSLGTIAVGGGLAGAAYLLLAARSSVPVALVALTAEGVFVPVAIVASLALRQRLIPDELLGRVGMVFRVVVFACLPAGALAGGLLARVTSYRHDFALAGAAQIAFLLVLAPRLWRHSKRRRLEEEVLDLEQEQSSSGAPRARSAPSSPAP